MNRDDWKIAKISECFTYIKNGANIKQDRQAKGIPITRIETLANAVFNRDRFGYANIFETEKYKEYLLEDGDILMSHIHSATHLGRAVVYHKENDEKIIHGMNLLKLKVDSNILIPAFAGYYFKSLSFKDEISKITKKAVNQASFSISDLKEIPIPIPPLETQSRIASELDLLNSIVSKKREQIRQLDALAQSLFYDTFGDPVLNEKGWEVKKLGEVCTFNPQKKEICLNEDDLISFLPMEDLQINAYKISPIQNRTLKEVYKSSYSYFADGDVIVAKVTPCFENGKIGIGYNMKNGVGFGTSEINVFRPNNLLLSEFVYFCLSTKDFREQGHNHLNGASGLRRVSKDFILNYDIPLPPLPLQKSFAEKIERIESQKESIKKSIKETQTLIDEAMQRYFG